MTKETEKKILQDPGTHKIVYEILELSKDRDCLDVYYDTLLAAEILKGRMDRILGGKV